MRDMPASWYFVVASFCVFLAVLLFLSYSHRPGKESPPTLAVLALGGVVFFSIVLGGISGSSSVIRSGTVISQGTAPAIDTPGNQAPAYSWIIISDGENTRRITLAAGQSDRYPVGSEYPNSDVRAPMPNETSETSPVVPEAGK